MTRQRALLIIVCAALVSLPVPLPAAKAFAAQSSSTHGAEPQNWRLNKRTRHRWHNKRIRHRWRNKRPHHWWRNERTRRLAAINEYLKQNQDAYDSFRLAPLAIKQGPLDFVGMSVIVFRLLPEIFPKIWGPPKDKLAVVGLGPDPFDPGSVFPIGEGFALSSPFEIPVIGKSLQVNYATFTCMGCHSGGVVGPDGNLIRMIGSPTPIGAFSSKLNETVNDPKYTAKRFRKALAKKPLGWVYQDPELLEQEEFERDLFMHWGGAEFFLEEVKFASNQSTQRIAETLLAYTYDVPNPSQPTGMPGSLDVFGFAAAGFCDLNGDSPCHPETLLPPAPSPADIPAVWQMSGRTRFQWDDSVTNLIYREVLASLSVSGSNPAAVNMDNVVLAGPFTEELPAYPYPFDVDQSAAERGEWIYRQACASCHEPGNNVLELPVDVGTDPNRANVLTPGIISGTIESAREACTYSECFQPDGEPYPDGDILKATMRYASIPLAGVWATAPYLHNGSVPTLYHLLTGHRPATFYRGNFTYDQDLVGYTWDHPTNPGLSTLYDTRLDGYSSTGHTGPVYNGGIDWDAEPDKLWDLLEYLKTL
jgi:mono/diheme cytochrome c family protein